MIKNETLETLKTRRSCRAYKPEMITDEELETVLELHGEVFANFVPVFAYK